MASNHNRRDFIKTITCASCCMLIGGLGCAQKNQTTDKIKKGESEMKEMIACCGIICSECGAYIATKTNDDELRKKTAEEWAQQFNADIKPETIYCDGCISEGGYLFSYCQTCEIRKCAMDKKLANCSYCKEYPCETISAFHKMAPAAKKTLDKINRSI